MTTAHEERLAEALKEACDLAHEGWTYAPEYFQQKWSSAERLAACRAALAEEPRNPAAPLESPLPPEETAGQKPIRWLGDDTQPADGPWAWARMAELLRGALSPSTAEPASDAGADPTLERKQ